MHSEWNVHAGSVVLAVLAFRHDTAIDMENLTCDIRGVIGSQINISRRQFEWLACAFHWGVASKGRDVIG